MGWLRRGKRDRPKAAGPPPADPLSAVPGVAPDVEWRPDAAELIQVRRRWRPQRGLAGLVARTFRLESVCRVNLDERGSFFWRQIDGRRDLRHIASRLAEQFDLTEGQAGDATVRFVKQLMTRCLIVLEVRRGDAGESATGSAGRGGKEDQP